MEDVTFELNNIQFNGKLNRKSEMIELTLSLEDKKYLHSLHENRSRFDVNGEFFNKQKFTAVNCFVYPPEIPLFGSYQIVVGKLYLNDWNISKILDVKKACVVFSHMPDFIKSEKVHVKRHSCSISLTNKEITIETYNAIGLNNMDNIIFELEIFFQIIILNKDVTQNKKYFYTQEDKKIEQILKEQKSDDEVKNQFLIRKIDEIDVSTVLNRWFDVKQKYGKVFDYLSGILNESSIVHLELKYFALAQWIEGYCRVRFAQNNQEASAEEEMQKQKVMEIIQSIQEVEARELLLKCYEFKKQDTFLKNLKKLLKEENFLSGPNIKKLVGELVEHRDYLVHINKEDNLNIMQISHLYEILKLMIYILILKELDAIKCINYKMFSEQLKIKYRDYKTLKKVKLL